MSKVHRICVVTCWFPTEGSKQGTFVQDISAALSQHTAHEVMVYHLHVHHGPQWLRISKHEYTDESRQLKVLTYEVSGKLYKWVYAAPPLLALMARADFAKRVVSSFKPTLLHAHVVHPAAIVASLLAKKHAIPTLITEHWSKLNKYFSRSIFRGLAYRAYAQAKAVVCVSDFLKTNVHEHAPHAKLTTIPNVVDQAFSPSQAAKNNEAIHLLCVAHWKAPKRLDLVVKAASHAASQSQKKVSLWVVGEGEELEKIGTEWPFELKKMGWKSKNEIAQLMKQCHFFLHASETETFSLVVAEALASGLPVLASRVGAIPTLVDTKQGVLVDNTPSAWQLGIEQMLNQTWNEQEIARNAQRFHATEVAKGYDAVLQQI